jgi:hypothetical protein
MAALRRYERTNCTHTKQQHTFGTETMLIIVLRTKRIWTVNVAHKGILSFHNIVTRHTSTDCSLLGVLLELLVRFLSE